MLTSRLWQQPSSKQQGTVCSQVTRKNAFLCSIRIWLAHSCRAGLTPGNHESAGKEKSGIPLTWSWLICPNISRSSSVPKLWYRLFVFLNLKALKQVNPFRLSHLPRNFSLFRGCLFAPFLSTLLIGGSFTLRPLSYVYGLPLLYSAEASLSRGFLKLFRSFFAYGEPDQDAQKEDRAVPYHRGRKHMISVSLFCGFVVTCHPTSYRLLWGLPLFFSDLLI